MWVHVTHIVYTEYIIFWKNSFKGESLMCLSFYVAEGLKQWKKSINILS